MTDQRDTWRSEARRVLSLAWPVMLSSLSWTLMQLTDVVVIGQAGTYEVAAFGASRTLTFIAAVMGMGWLSGVLVNIARAEGAQVPQTTGRFMREGVLLGALLGLVTGGAMVFWGEAMLRMIGVEASLIPLTTQVVMIMGIAFPIQMLATPIGYFFQAIGRPRRSLAITCVTLPINGVLAWAWAGGHLGFDAMGAVGASWATLTASAIGLALNLVSVWWLDQAKLRRVRDIGLSEWRQALHGVPALARFGFVPAIASALELGGFAWVMVQSTTMGLTAAHAFQLVLSMHNITFGFAMGFGSAAGVRVGNAVGEGVPQAALGRTMVAAVISTIVIGVMSLALMIGAPWFVSLYPATDAVRQLGVTMLFFWAPFMLFDGLQLVGTYALRSLGDQVAAGVNAIIAFFFLTIGVGWWFIRMGQGPLALVWAVGIGMLACAVLQMGRLWWFIVVAGRLKSSG
jgi:multidrug resistance protein, MATE family